MSTDFANNSSFLCIFIHSATVSVKNVLIYKNRLANSLWLWYDYMVYIVQTETGLVFRRYYEKNRKLAFSFNCIHRAYFANVLPFRCSK